MKLNKILILMIFSFSFLSQGFTQSDISIEKEPVPDGRTNIKLGMDIEAVKIELLKDPDFNYRGDPDVSMLPDNDRQIIDCDGAFYIERGYFQFNEDKLYLITIVLDEEYVDHYSMYSALKEKYGEPDMLDPSKTIWQNEKLRLTLERPLSIKYIDLEVFQKLQQDSFAEESFETILRQDFIDSF